MTPVYTQSRAGRQSGMKIAQRSPGVRSRGGGEKGLEAAPGTWPEVVARNRPERSGAVLAISLPLLAARAAPADLEALEALAAD
jgi:hypothetical protein